MITREDIGGLADKVGVITRERRARAPAAVAGRLLAGASLWEYHAALSRQARPGKAQRASWSTAKTGTLTMLPHHRVEHRRLEVGVRLRRRAALVLAPQPGRLHEQPQVHGELRDDGAEDIRCEHLTR